MLQTLTGTNTMLKFYQTKGFLLYKQQWQSNQDVVQASDKAEVDLELAPEVQQSLIDHDANDSVQDAPQADFDAVQGHTLVAGHNGSHQTRNTLLHASSGGISDSGTISGGDSMGGNSEPSQPPDPVRGHQVCVAMLYLVPSKIGTLN